MARRVPPTCCAPITRTRAADAVVVSVRAGVSSELLFEHAPLTATTHITMATRRIIDAAGRSSAGESALPQREAAAAEDEHDPDRGEREARRTGERQLLRGLGPDHHGRRTAPAVHTPGTTHGRSGDLAGRPTGAGLPGRTGTATGRSRGARRTRRPGRP